MQYERQKHFLDNFLCAHRSDSGHIASKNLVYMLQHITQFTSSRAINDYVVC